MLHNDIYDKNMLVDGTHGLARLIDLDAVALCNESFSVMMTLRMYPLANHCEYMDYYEDTMQRKINREAIMTGLKILNTIRKTKSIVVAWVQCPTWPLKTTCNSWQNNYNDNHCTRGLIG